MRPFTSRASHLVTLTQVLKPQLRRSFHSNLNLQKRAPHTLISISRVQSRSIPTTTATQNIFRNQKRHCSYQRMCFARGGKADMVEGSLNVTSKRELLPANIKPTHYDLTLEPDLEKFTYEGTVIIDLDVVEDTKSMSLHSLDIDIKSTVITAGETEVTSDPHVSYDKDKQTTMVTFDKTIPAGSKAQLKHTFTGILNDTMAGFYRSSYNGPNGEKKYIASTQMEPTDARRAFPCFDEPSLKATFTVTLIADKELTCLGNMDVASEKEVDSKMSGGKKKAVTFNKSPVMSTYLVAFIVGEFKVIESSDFRCPIRVFATPDQDINHGKFALETAAKTLAFYEKAFDNEFPLPKMDMVAIPDFSAGAMENWGLITYRVVDLLFDEKISGASTKERVAEVVQHELAHQWFGNLVTMDWWDGLWLNEGFATWMSWYSCNEFYPEWKVWESYVIDNLQGALALDSLRSSHPIEVPVNKAEEINQIFDAISYSKGSVVLRMISKYLGEETFIDGVRRYIHKHAYGNTQTSDLWAALSDASGKPVEEVMGTWTKKMGYPVITVDEDESSSSIKLTQNRFLRTGDVTPEEDKTIFPVFLGLRTKDGIDEQLALSTRSETYKLPSLDFFKLNANHSGMYRTSYTPARLSKLGLAAKQGLLSVEDRAGMIADAGALSSSGYQKTSGVLSLIKSFDSEKEFIVWNELVSRIATIRATWTFEDQKVRDALKAFQLALVSAKAHELGWTFTPGEDHILQQFKALLFGTAGVSGDAEIVKASQDMFAAYLAGDKSAIHPNLRGSVYNMVLQSGGEAEYDGVLSIALSGATADERNTALRCLGRAKEPHLIQKTLDLCLNGQVKAQDIYMPLAGLRAHTEGIDARWKWMTANWEALVKKLPPGLNMLSTVVQLCAGSFTTEAQMSNVQDFFKEKDTKGYDRAIEISLDNIRSKTSWLNRDRGDVEGWLKENGFSGKGSEKL